MAPAPSRRDVLSALAAAGVAGVAGCTGSPGSGGETTRPPTSAEPTTAASTTAATTDEPTTGESADAAAVDPADSPVAAVESAFTAEDVEGFQSRFHPLHPMSAERMTREQAEPLHENASEPTTVERADREVTVDLVLSSTLPGSDVERAAVEDALDGAGTAVVTATVEGTDSGTQRVQFVTVERDGGWLVLAQGLPAPEESSSGVLEARVVGGVAFEADQEAARVQFVSDVVADGVTVESVRAGESTSTSTPGSTTYLEVGVDPEGDEVVVSATVDDESRVVHRERFPEDDRLVDDVEFVADPETDDRDAIARVTFNDTDGEGRVRVVSTVNDGSAEAEPAGSLNYLNVGVDPEGDEVVVTYPVGDDAEEVHRERWHP
ncbi:twin-arginine translocation signal domain-containing protein [Halobacterium yunchengense]|uniref:twin-arginine translocation signal domain-containing protein n=1 Tax=Halobacterium yunchengense TaxID=3108497 RepID=UPI0030095A45